MILPALKKTEYIFFLRHSVYRFFKQDFLKDSFFLSINLSMLSVDLPYVIANDTASPINANLIAILKRLIPTNIKSSIRKT